MRPWCLSCELDEDTRGEVRTGSFAEAEPQSAHKKTARWLNEPSV